MSKLFLSFGNQLFHPRYLARFKDAHIVLVEDEHFCTKYAYHKQKLVFILAAMANYAQLLRDHGFRVSHFRLDDQRNWRSAIRRNGCKPSKKNCGNLTRNWKDKQKH